MQRETVDWSDSRAFRLPLGWDVTHAFVDDRSGPVLRQARRDGFVPARSVTETHAHPFYELCLALAYGVNAFDLRKLQSDGR